jgi:glucokinase
MMSRPHDELFVGLDMGGTDIKATVTSGAGDLLTDGCDRVLTRAGDGPATTLEQLALAGERILVRANLPWDRVVGVGLDTPGPASVDGVLDRSPVLDHPEWVSFPVRAALEARLGRPVTYANDANAAGYWEYFRQFGDDRGKTMVALTLGTGLGGAFVWGGEVLTGAHGFGGEFGHIRLPTHELVTDGFVPVCACGGTACAMAFASITSLDIFLRRALARPEHADHPLTRVPDVGRDRALRLLALAETGDRLALSLFDRQADALGILLVQLANCFDPDVFAIGGGLSEASEVFRSRFLERVRARFHRDAFPALARDAVIAFAEAKDLAGCRGAALLARRAHARQRGPSRP